MRLRVLLFLTMCWLGAFAQLDKCTVVGWATQNGGTTGGGSAAAVTVSTYADFKSKLEDNTTKVIHVSGTITIPAGGRVSMKDVSNKSIIGLAGSKMVSTDMTKTGSGILMVTGCKNIIFRNLYFEGPGAYDTDGYDNICFDNCQNIWVDHCEFHDGMDGNLDIKNMSNYISVTWCTFSYEKPPKAGGPGGAADHRYTSLFGSSDGATDDDGKLCITMAYCWWGEGCRERMPRVRFGKIHMINNLFTSSVSNHCIRAGYKANILAEGNYFDNQKLPIDEYEKNYTAILGRNNYGAAAIAKGTIFTPPYTMTAAAAADIVTPIKTCAGQKLTSTNGCSSCGSTTPIVAPVVSITSPANNATFTAPASIAIKATATDSDGSIAKVEFYSGTTLLGAGTASGSTYSYTWANVAAGTYSITAKATDNAGNTTVSSAISVLVTAAAVPTLTNTGSLTQTVTSGTAITSIVYTWGGTATDVTYTTLPAGLTATKNTTNKTLTVSGTPTANGSFTVTTSGGTPAAKLDATITLGTTPPIGTCDLTLDGFASVSGDGITKTTGGAGGTETTVTNETDLTTWVSAAEKNTTARILYISGKIEAATSTVLTIKNGANITIIGKNGGELKNIGLNIRDYNNVIVQNLTIHEVAYPNDALTLDNVNHGWVTHCDFYSQIGSGVTYDTYDGMLDVKNGSKYVTISWNRIHHHMKTMLFGHTDNVNSQTTDQNIRVTLHHNYVFNTDGRNPSLRWGAVHSYNNYFNGVSDYGMAVRRYAHAKIENNYYKNVKTPIATDKFIVDSGDDGLVCESGCIFDACGANSITKTDCSWWNATNLPYTYTPTATANVPALVESGAGVCGITYNAQPTAKITAPVDKATYPASSNIAFTISTADADGSVAKVVYFTKSEDKYTILGTVTSSPFNFTWNSVAAGTYSVFAYVYDNTGAFSISNCVNLTVGGTASVPTLTDPTNKSQTVDANVAIASIVFTWGGTATDVTVASLPAGLTATKNTTAKTVTISGTPTAGGTYTVTTVGGTPAVTVTGIITLNSANAATLVGTNLTQSYTANTAIAAMVFTWGGSATDVSYTTLPTGLTAVKNTTAKTLTVSGTPAAVGSFSVSTIGGSNTVTLAASISTSCNAVIANWYPFQESAISLPFVSYTSATLNTAFDASAYTTTGSTNGALSLTKGTGTLTLTLKSLKSLKIRWGATGGRTLQVTYGATGTENTWNSASQYSAGGYEHDLTTMIPALVSDAPIIVNIINNRTDGGNVNITDLYIEGAYKDCNATEQSIALVKGWNLISFNVVPADASIATLFKGLDVQEIKDINTFWRKGQDAAFNSLTALTPGAGYYVNMNAAASLTISGTAMTASKPTIASTASWCLVGCPYQSATAIATAFDVTKISVVKNLEAFWDGTTTGTLKTIEPGKGYFVKVK